MNIRAVLFDLDDTLFDHRHSCRAGLSALRDGFDVLKGLGDEELEERYFYWLELIHLGVLSGKYSSDQARVERLTGFFSDFGLEVDAQILGEAGKLYSQAYRCTRRVVPGCLDVLIKLFGHVKLGIITNNLVEHQIPKIRECGLENYFSSVTISEEAGVNKPDPDIFSIALERMDSTPEETAIVGDSWTSDIEGGSRAGLKCIWLNRYEVECPDPAIASEIRSFYPTAEIVDTILG